MAWRFKASKYRNATPIVPKPENYVREISVGSYQTHGNNITASALFMAFNWDHVGSSVAVLPLNDSGRKSKLMPLLHAHTDTVTDLDFSPFHDGLLVTGSQDCSVKLWCIPEGGLTDSVSNPECTFSHRQRRVETVKFHPTSDFLLHSSSYTTLTLWDITSQKEIFSNSDEHTDVIQSASWKRDGTLLATSCKDKKLRILDPRAGKFCLGSADSHQSIKDSRVVWLGDRDRVLTSGFNAQRLRQIIVRDIRNLGSMEKELQLDCSTGILIPLYDGDTGMLFLAGKGDTTIGYMEVSDKEPYLVEGIRHSGEQTKGACLVPKRALNVMQGEVNRVLQLTSNSVIPITYQVPRKSYRDFHSDLYPDTSGYVSKLTASQWIAGKDFPVPKISLNPKDRENGDSPITVHRGPLKKLKQDYEATVIAKPEPNPPPTTTTPSPPKPIKPLRNEQEMPKPQPQPLNTVQVEDTIEDSKSEEMVVPPKPLPRTSRAGSLCEPLDEANAPPKPVARSRTNSYAPVITSVNPNAPRSGGYKPRLGPKPFSPPKFDDSESFQKVFSVPTVPGVHSNGSTELTKIQNDSLETKITNDSEETEKIEDNIESDVKPNGMMLESPPSTAERRKLFEDQDEEVSNNGEVMDKVDSCEFERNALRKSIAERRKIYENRSLSVQDDNSNSVIAKNRKNVEAIAEDGNVKRQQSLDNTVGKKSGEVISTPTPKRTSTVFGKVSKFRHLKGTPAHKSLHIENLRNLSRQIPGECDGFHANPERAATPLSGPGGKIAILETNKTGRLPDGVIPTLVQGSNVMDFAWDPFDNRRLAVACDDGIVKIWEIPENGLTEPTNEPTAEFQAHPDKIYFVKFNPVAKDVLATGSFDMTVKIWDLNGFQERICLTGHTDQMFSFAWSPCGRYCATVCKDGKIRVFDPRNKDVPIREGNGPVGSRGARIVWALDGNFLVVTGFDKVSERQITVYKWTDLKAPLNVVGLDVSPAILVPFYDEDSSTLFLTGRGDSTIYTFEITEEHPFICPLSHHRCSTLNQGLSFLPKKSCDVTNVEFAKALRLTNNTIEPLSFTVPRIKTDLFQDDLFPPTRVSWNPLLNSEDWFLGKNGVTKRISLQPEGMEPLTSTQNQKSTPEKSANKSSPQLLQHDLTNPCARLVWESQSKMKQEEIQKSVSQRLPVNMKLEQDSMEGVDEKEWEE